MALVDEDYRDTLVTWPKRARLCNAVILKANCLAHAKNAKGTMQPAGVVDQTIRSDTRHKDEHMAMSFIWAFTIVNILFKVSFRRPSFRLTQEPYVDYNITPPRRARR
ncbi:hypothetical protein M405DRAFT_235074 [Rhizopogon salebrosus TDB-379]|nr:hypothetical protein M405DRAFT_235074 [Rhizopogon salebrosus TDB-379]